MPFSNMGSLMTLLFFIMGLIWTSAQKPELDQQWEEFKEIFHKNYTSPSLSLSEEEMKRRLIWEDNVEYIEKHNREVQSGSHSHLLEINFFADMTPEEIAEKYTGYIPMNDTEIDPDKIFTFSEDDSLPETVNWVKAGMVTAAKSQGLCGSCWAFSATGALEAQHALTTGNLVSLSEQNLVDCVKTNFGCRGGLVIPAFRYIKYNGGIATEDSYPYVAKNGPCRYDPENRGATLSSWKTIPRGDEKALQAAVANIGPISVAINTRQKDFLLYKKGIYSNSQCSNKMANHAVLVTGYGSQDGEDYWMIKNSWGVWWGINGYIYIARNKNNLCRIADDAVYPIV